MSTIVKSVSSHRERPVASTRVNLRMAPEVKRRIIQAARLRRVVLTEFMIAASQAASDAALAERTQFSLSPQKWREFNAALDASPREIPELRRLFASPDVFGAA